jgi:hypothetical protein
MPSLRCSSMSMARSAPRCREREWRPCASTGGFFLTTTYCQ